MLNIIKRFGKKDKNVQSDATVSSHENVVNDEGAVDRDTMDLEGNTDTVEYEIVEREILPEKIICPDCGGITLQGLDFCDKCGGELQ